MMEQWRGLDDPETFKAVRRGWCFGEQAFREELKEQMGRRMGADHYGEERRDRRAEGGKNCVEELKRHGWKGSELTLQPKGHKVKIAIAKRLRKETTMTLKWIAQRLQMGSWTYVFNLLASEKSRKKR